ncbi:MAG: four helix bundle protein [Candidatus Roizmanbacteria bacterium]|nr:MAG: four helix bundle protein [Candidatus Roizmanbacteria bacterium]
MNFNNQFEKLEVWNRSHKLVLKIYEITKYFPMNEKYSLVDQIRRSSASISTNIVEGNERGSKKDFVRFLYMSKSSLAETKYQIILAKDLKYIDEHISIELLNEANKIGMMISGLIRYLKTKI